MTNIDTVVHTNGESPEPSSSEQSAWAKFVAWITGANRANLRAENRLLQARVAEHEAREDNALRIARNAGRMLERYLGTLVESPGLGDDGKTVVFSNEYVNVTVGVFSGRIVVSPLEDNLDVSQLVLKTRHALLTTDHQEAKATDRNPIQDGVPLPSQSPQFHPPDRYPASEPVFYANILADGSSSRCVV